LLVGRGQLVSPDAQAAVFDLDRIPVAHPGAADPDHGLRRGEGDRVLDQFGQ